jgi:hypothetical protein
MVYKINYFMKTKKTIIALILWLMFYGIGFAQNGSLYLMPSVQGFNFSNLNNDLKEAGFAETPVTFGSGAGGFGVYKQWRFGGEGTYFSGERFLEENSTVAQGGWGFFYAGYQLSNRTWRIVPQAGIGFGGLTIHATRPTSAASVGQLLQEGNSTSLSMGGSLLHTALSIEKEVSNNFYVGIKSSYNISLSGKTAWSAKGLSNATTDTFNGLQVALIVGFILK